MTDRPKERSEARYGRSKAGFELLRRLSASVEPIHGVARADLRDPLERLVWHWGLGAMASHDDEGERVEHVLDLAHELLTALDELRGSGRAWIQQTIEEERTAGKLKLPDGGTYGAGVPDTPDDVWGYAFKIPLVELNVCRARVSEFKPPKRETAHRNAVLAEFYNAVAHFVVQDTKRCTADELEALGAAIDLSLDLAALDEVFGLDQPRSICIGRSSEVIYSDYLKWPIGRVSDLSA